jgi:Ca2+-binding RTX toxin-like protein
MRRRALLILTAMVLGVMLPGGVALAQTIDGTPGPDDLVGTDKDDIIHGSGGIDYVSGLAATDWLYGGADNDTVVGREGNDRIYGNSGFDRLYGNLGKDTITAGDAQEDLVNCGEGGDTAFVDEEDTVYKNCENVFVERGSEGPNPGAKSGA